MFTFAIREGLLESDKHSPVTGTESREEVARDRLLTDDEIRVIWVALDADDYGDIIKLLVLTGCRRQEIGGLRWGEVDLDRGLVSLPAERAKKGRPHVIALSTPAVEILQARARDRETVFGSGGERL